MNALLDTHTLVWALIEPERLSQKAERIIEENSNRIFVSAATAWELATKVRSGKFPKAEAIERDFLKFIDEAGFTLLSIDTPAALRAGRFTADHRDPFDRILAAQALAQDIPILSIDKQLDAFGARRVW